MRLDEALLDAFININVLLCVGFFLWLVIRAGMRRAGLAHAHATQLGLLNALFVAVLLTPFAVLGFGLMQRAGIASDVNLTLSDLVVSHYLNGGFEMKAERLEGLIQSRETLSLQLLSGAGWLAWGVIVLFLAGLAVGLVRLGYSVLCLRRIVAHSYPWRSIGRVQLRLSDRTLVPFSTRGLRGYHIVLPSGMLGQGAALRLSIAHELQHIRNGDLEWEIVMEALKPLFFLNPVYHLWKRQVEVLRELACDAHVIGRQVVDLRAYCDTLLSVCQQTLRRDRAFVIAVPKVTLVTAGRSSFLDHRIRSILDARTLSHPRALFAAVLVPVIAATVLTSLAIQRSGDWSQDRLMLSTVVNLERLDAINQNSGFGRASR